MGTTVGIKYDNDVLDVDGNYEAALSDTEQVTLNKWPDKSLYHAMVLG